MYTKAHDARQRHIERCRYSPQDYALANRPTRIFEGVQQTLKCPGDFIITSAGKHEVTQPSWF